MKPPLLQSLSRYFLRKGCGLMDSPSIHVGKLEAPVMCRYPLAILYTKGSISWSFLHPLALNSSSLLMVMFSELWGILSWGSEDSSTHCLRISGEVKPPWVRSNAMMASARLHRTSTGFLVEMGTRAVPIIKSYILRAWLLVLDLTLPGAEASWRELVVCFCGGGEVIPGKDPTGVCLSSLIGAHVWIILCLMKMSPKHIPFPWRIKIITVTTVNMY